MNNPEGVLGGLMMIPSLSGMAAMIEERDWSRSALGGRGHWPAALSTLVDLMLGANQPMFICWGEDRTLLYNDQYAALLEKKHPAALGKDILQVWDEIADDLRPIVDRAYAGQSVHMSDISFLINRTGDLEEAHFSFSYTPIRLDAQVAGFFCACTETTRQVLAERKLAWEADRQHQLFQQAPGFITILNGADHRFEFVNAAYEKLFGPREFIGRPVRDVFPELEGQDFFRWLDQVYRTGEQLVAENLPITLKGPEGTLQQLYLTFIYQPVTDSQGRTTGIFCEGFDVTEAYRAKEAAQRSEERLRESEERLRLATELTEVGLWDADLQRQTRSWSPQMRAMFGVSADAHVAMDDFLEGLHPDDRPFVEQAYNDAIDSEKRAFYDVEYRTIGRDDGMIRWVAAKGRGIFNDRGTCVRVLGTALDVTRRRQAEAAQRAQSEEFAAVFDAVPAGIWIARDPSCRDIVGNQVAHALTRMPVGSNMSKSAPADEAPTHFKVFRADGIELAPDEMPVQRAARGELVRNFEEQIIFDDGSVIHLLGNATPLHDERGDVRGAVAAFVDISDRKAIETSLRESEERFRQLAETLDQVFYVTELKERRLSYLSPAYEKVWGRPVEDLVADLSFFFDTIHPDDREQVASVLPSQMAGLSAELEYRIIRGDGAVRWIRDRFFPIRSADGELVRAVGLAEDITESKQLQDQLLSLNETLEQRVLERTKELQHAEEALRQSQKLEAMGQLTGGVAHDFNNLLTPIIGSLDMLQRRGLGDDRARRQIDGALQSAERAKTLVQRLLAFARRQPLQATAVDMEALVTGISELITSTLGPQIELVTDIESDLPSARADGNQVEMAILNLAVNARDAMPNGGRLTISCNSVVVSGPHPTKLSPGSYLRLAVIDTGAGMDEATIKRAIEPFFSTKGVGKGTGLGLSMVHGLASQLGGALTIASRVQHGTSVELWLPAADGSAQSEDAEPAKLKPHGVGTVLLVDDDQLVRSSTADMLTDMGYEVEEAISAEHALQLMSGGIAFDLLITDHLMPGMTGTDLVSAVRSRSPNVPVLVISGYAEDAGIDPDLPRLIKPFRQHELEAMLTSLTAK